MCLRLCACVQVLDGGTTWAAACPMQVHMDVICSLCSAAKTFSTPLAHCVQLVGVVSRKDLKKGGALVQVSSRGTIS